MSDEKINLSRRKVLGGLVTLGAAGAASGAGTFALFSDQESSSGNTIQSGTLNLDSPTTTTQVTSTDLAPGQSTSGQIELDKAGSLTGDHLEIAVGGLSEPSETQGPNGVDKTMTDVAENVYLERIGYGSGYSNSRFWFHDLMPTVQVPGAFVYHRGSNSGNSSINGTSDGTEVDISSATVNSESGIHVSSNDASVQNYVHLMTDVSGASKTIGDNSSISYDTLVEPSSSNTVNTPDEVKIIVEDGGETRYFWKSYADDTVTDDGTWHNYSLDLTSGWNETDIQAGTWGSVGGSGDLTSGASDASVKFLGVGLGGVTSTTSNTFDLYLKDPKVGGSTYSFPTTPPTVHELQNNPYVVDNLMAPGGGETFDYTFRLDENVGNAFQGDGVNVTFEFGLAQESGQNVL